MSSTVLRMAEAVSEYSAELQRVHLAKIAASYTAVEYANHELHRLTGIRRFFEDQIELEEFKRLAGSPIREIDTQTDREWGDFQTPPGLAARVCHYLAQLGIAPEVIVEPTYGAGNFIVAALESFPQAQTIYGVEIQEKYKWRLKISLLIRSLLGSLPAAEIELHQDSVFTHRFPPAVTNAPNLLVIGNPPWVTNAELGSLGSGNLPKKQNIKVLNGMDALTGKSNFDISEYILLRLLESFSECRGTLAMLCKTSTARNIVAALSQKRFKVANIRTLTIDAPREFGAAVDACLLVTDLGASVQERTCQIAALDKPDQVTRVFGWVGNRFVSDVKEYETNSDLDGESPAIWRQGLKHDCARIMELAAKDNELINGNDEMVDVEDSCLYWLLKSSDLRRFEAGTPRRKVVVTQTILGEDTSALGASAPKLWKYLMENSHWLDGRKSSIYRDKPRFSIFGIGDYSFKKYKVAISGLYKEPLFSLVCPIDDRPVMLDDTCYLLGFDTYLEALFTASLLNSDPVKRFLRSIVFLDAKRPYTKEALMRINLSRAAARLSLQSLRELWASARYEPRVSIAELDLEIYKQGVLGSMQQQSMQLGLGV